MPRVVVLDLLFNWPPDGGARVDTLELTRYLTARHDTTLLIPQLADAFPRGRLDVPAETLGIHIRGMPVSREVDHHDALLKLIHAELQQLEPDRLIIGDAWHLKPRLIAGLSAYRPVVRFYAHEGLCVKGHGHRYVNEQVCHVDTLERSAEYQEHCRSCWEDWRAHTTTRVFDREIELAAPWDGTYLDDLRAGLRRARAVVVTNTEMVARLRPHSSRIILQPMGVDAQRFAAKSAPAGGRFLLHGRAYDYLKGGHVFIEAARRLHARRTDFTIALTGRPPQTDADSLPEYVELLEPVPHEEVPAMIESALACVLPPLWPEPLPLSALEALSCGRPLIASAVGGLPDLVEPERNGLLVPPNDPDALADAMHRLLDDPQLVRRLSAAAVQTAKHYAWPDLHERAYGPLLAEL